MLLETIALVIQLDGSQTCAGALSAAPGYQACAQGTNGLALSDTQAGADLLLAQAEAAEVTFKRGFSESIPPYLVFYFDADPPLAELDRAGFSTVLAWPSPKHVASLLTTALRQQALARAGGSGTLPDAAEAALTAQTAAVLSSIESKQEGVVAHELGHVWYSAVFWRDSGVAPDGYGSPAPDWLDESAAVLTEGASFADDRRRLFVETWNTLEPAGRFAPESIGDLDYFLTRQHPSQRQAVPPVESGSGSAATVSVVVRGGGDGKEAYYNQVRVFADYLIDRTGDAAVFAEITRALAAGSTFGAWLGSQVRYPTLRRTIPELQADWSDWIARGAA
ncbi:MAG: hypothetical protein Q8S03_10370 [Brevundimonas sp.]|uniref:hypothetical protein n=1 Tax=Brevundimonas sp. TaxID=1871086 RepID=UPI0027346FE8|nr:hypothetical protein [Brevundimonas sp.]MDP3405084.1 hypothetical protein [Brevundimonas sp.]